jgi:hypothetical protein
MTDETQIEVVQVSAKGPLRIEGNVYDIDRVLQAVRDAMRKIEIERRDPNANFVVMVPGPDPTYEAQRVR